MVQGAEVGGAERGRELVVGVAVEAEEGSAVVLVGQSEKRENVVIPLLPTLSVYSATGFQSSWILAKLALEWGECCDKSTAVTLPVSRLGPLVSVNRGLSLAIISFVRIF